MSRDFNAWLSGFRDSIADYGYYIDFEKVHRNVDNIKVELNILNSLIGSKNIEADFENLMRKYPEVLKCIPLLLAVRANEIYCQDENGGHLFQFNFGKYPPNSHAHYERYKYFMRETRLFDLLENHIVNNLVDYATGVETGLDSNGRKNRGGHLMENLVESFIQKQVLSKMSHISKKCIFIRLPINGALTFQPYLIKEKQKSVLILLLKHLI